MRLNVWVPDELAETVRERLPGVNVSRTLQEQLRKLLGCTHEQVMCADCAKPIERHSYVDHALSTFYVHLALELEDLMHRGGTAEGACLVAKRVAAAHNISRADRTLTRPARPRRARRFQRVEQRDAIADMLANADA